MSDEAKLREYLRKVATDLRKATRRARELEEARREPIAIVAMGCRYPGGASSPEALWRLVASETDAISTFPTDRGWDLKHLYDADPDQPGKVSTRHSGFLHDAAEFDADFFGISRREALAMDPQQRLMLEIVWEVCEQAGIPPDSLRGTPTGVFAGVIHDEYGTGIAPEAMPSGIEVYKYGGTASSVFCGRVAYGFGFQGPAVAVNTACSSSLVALHLACQALRQGECSLAFAGGVTVMSTTSLLLAFSRQRALSPDGRCRAFAAAADGVGFSEGAGVLLLERLSDALRNGHPVQAVIRGSAINQDGASNGLTAPNGPSQERVIMHALANAGLSPADVDAVEAHGTGTPLGDPIEAHALLATYGQGRRSGPLRVGSIKSNIGHTSAAAGVAGVVKMVMAMRHEQLPATLHLDAPSPHVDWSMGELELLREPASWPPSERPRRAGVSSFGASGTNAHVVLEEAPPQELEPEPGSQPTQAHPFVLSANSAPALRAQAARLRAHLLERPGLAARDLAFSLATTRAHLKHRAAVIASERESLLEHLDALAREEPTSAALRGVAVAGKTVFVFPGQGAQWEGMALKLLDSSPVFAQAMRDCEEALSRYIDWSLIEVLRGGQGQPRLERVDVVQPTLFAVMVSLAALWRSARVEPAMVVGHSQGEIAAAHVAGGLSLQDAARVVALRSLALADELAGRGGMVSVAVAPEQVEELLKPYEGRVSLAAVNGPGTVVVSGVPDALAQLLAQCKDQDIRARQIPVNYASHSVQVEAIRERLHEDLAPIEPRTGSVPFFSATTASLLDTAELTAAYWYRSLREHVQFAQATRTLIEEGAYAFIEVSPHPVLIYDVGATIESLGAAERVVTFGSLQRKEGGEERFLASLAEAHVHGVEVNWRAVFADTGARRVELPTYAFQRERFWLQGVSGAGDVTRAGLRAANHPLLGAAMCLADRDEWVFTGRVSTGTHEWLADHVVLDTVVVPGAALAEVTLRAGLEVGCPTVEELTFEAPLVLEDDRAVALQVTLAEPDEEGRRVVAIYSCPQDSPPARPDRGEAVEPGVVAVRQPEWRRHARGVLAPAPDSKAIDPQLQWLGEESWPPEGAERVDVEPFYDRLLELGFAYGPAFQGVGAAWRRAGEVFAEIALDERQAGEAARFCAHPALFDAALHGLYLLQGEGALDPDGLPLPFAWSGISVHRAGASVLRVRLAQADDGAQTLAALDQDGAPALFVQTLATRPVHASQLRPAHQGSPESSLFGLEWLPVVPALGGAQQRIAAIGELWASGVQERYADLQGLCAAIEAGSLAPDVVLVGLAGEGAGGNGECDLAAAARECVRTLLALLQAWLAEERLADTRLAVVTRGATVVRPGEAPDAAGAAALGLLRSAQSEHPGQFLALDLDPGASGEERKEELIWEQLLASEEPQLAIRDGELHAPRLRCPGKEHEPARDAARALDGTVLITGGTGGLGAQIARHLASAHDVGRLLLLNRRGLEAEGAQELVAELAARGCNAHVHACDVADRESLAALIDAIPDEQPLRAVIHAAGVLGDGVIETLTDEQVDRVMRPKIEGALNLHELTAELPLRAFVLFSSASTLFGGSGQGNYSAANAFLDALAQRRRAQGLVATSLAWGLWGEASGMTRALDRAAMARMTRLGMAALDSEEGLALFDRALDMPDAMLAPVLLDAAALRSQARLGMLPALLQGVVRTPARRWRDASGSLARRLLDLPESEWDGAVLEVVRGQVASILGHDSLEVVAPRLAFKELGFDSLAAVELRNQLMQTTGLRLPVTLVFDHPNAIAVASFLRSQIEQDERAAPATARRPVRTGEPIAIVGMGCRYPGGVGSPQELWELLLAGTDAITPFPEDRGWSLDSLFDPDPDRRGTSYVREGGFLHDAGEFDAGFFGISPREALAMDPQQRLMLEVAWEALEDARIEPMSLRGSDTSVFAGASSSSYLENAVAQHEGLTLTGTTTSVVSGRLSYVLGLEGAAVSIDTACSSSLVALHLACQALRLGECSLALAGGVTVQATPGMFVEFSRQRALSRDGRCKSFGAGADGTVWSEGIGVLALECLSDARANGRRILALVRGSATNQDGASNGLTAPNGPAQERVIRQALANAGLSADDIDAVEAHGTGTALGDPIEAQALLATYGRERTNGPLRLGSIKSNLGHCIAAAGVAGVIKMVMALRQQVLPRTLHAEDPSPHVDWSSGDIRLLTLPEPWLRNERPRRAGVSSFGVSGTNAHVILEEAPTEEIEHRDGDTPAREPALALLLSAKSEEALRGQARRLLAHLHERPELTLADVALSLVGTREQFEWRAAAIGTGREAPLAGLRALAEGESAANVVQGAASWGRTAFLFSGQGAQRSGMGAQLHRAFPVFAQELDRCCAELDPHLGCSLKEVMFAEEGSPQAAQLDGTAFAQASMFALEVALFRLLESCGLEPDLLIGHSVGELAAVHVAGVLSLADACKLVAARGRLMAALPPGGAMFALEASEQELDATVCERAQSISLAAVNGPRAVVLSGEEGAIEELEAEWQGKGRRTTRLRVSHAFHSPLMEPMLADFRGVAESVSYQEPTLAIVSNLPDARHTDPEYWVRHVRETVRFADGVQKLECTGVTRFLELGPDSVLCTLARESLGEELGERALLTSTLRRGRDEGESFVRCLAQAHVHGAQVDWRALLLSVGEARQVDLPMYAFQHKRYWQLPCLAAAGLAQAGLHDLEHPLLGAGVRLAGEDQWLFTGRLSLATHPWLADHAMFDTVLLPGTSVLELALAAGRMCECEAIEELTLETPLVIPEQGGVLLQLVVEQAEQAGRRAFALHTCPDEALDEATEAHDQWSRCASGVLAPAGTGEDEAAQALATASWPPEGAEPIQVEFLHDRLGELGFGYGPAFRLVHAAWRREHEIFVEVGLAAEHAGEAARFVVHPALLDASLHPGLLDGDEDLGVRLPFSWRGVRLHQNGASSLRVCVAETGENAMQITALDEHGVPVVTVEDVLGRPVEAAQLQRRGADTRTVFRIEWPELAPDSPNDAVGRVALLGEAAAGPDGSFECYADLDELRTAIADGAPAPDVVVAQVAAADCAAGEETAPAALAQVERMLKLLQEWLAEECLLEARLVLVTRQALVVGGAEMPSLEQAPLAGLLRSAQAEYPGRFALLDLEAGELLGPALKLALAAEEQPQLAVRAGKLHAPRLARVPQPAQEAPKELLDAEGTVLITGGTGMLGMVVARHLVLRRGVRHLLLTSRRGAQADGAAELVVELEGLGCAVIVAACDVSERERLAELLASIPGEHPLRAVIHAAGVLDDGVIETLSPEQVRRVMRPKVEGALNLHELTRDLELSEFAMFSSAVATIGGPGQGAYAAANAFLDALAHARCVQGLPGRSLAWGLWNQEGGMAGGLDLASAQRLQRLGILAIEGELGLTLLDAALGTEEPLLVLVRLDVPALRGQARMGMLPAVLRGLVRAPARSVRAGSLARRLASAPESEWDALVLALVRAEVAAVLGESSSYAVEPERAFKDLGFDSLAAVELRNRLHQSTGMRLPATLVFDHPTPAGVARFLRSRVAGTDGARRVVRRARMHADEPIAIVGMSCRYPGGVSSPEELWQLVATGTDAISGFPQNRGWDLDQLYDPNPVKPGTFYTREGGFMQDIASFDPDFFGISPREALSMDPQQRLLLEGTWEACEQAGIDPVSLRGSETGVFSGVMYQDYGVLASSSSKRNELEGYLTIGSAGSVASGRVAYTFGFEGPAMTVDTACSSSLVALHLACQALRHGECSLALAGGATVLTSPMVFIDFARQRGLAADGRCKSFAGAADGVSWSEGVGLLIVERLADAQRNGHEVLALVRGSAINQDGASNGLVAPNGPSQERVIHQALANAGLLVGDVQAVEGHGTGTTLGDPIEAQALLSTYGRERANGPLWLGSIKSNIGHAQAAAGVAGVIKMVMALRHGELPPTLHVDEPSPHVDWSAGEVRLLTKSQAWPAGERVRRAAVSSFGVSGTNAHVILEEPPVASEAPALPGTSALPALPLLVSAKSEERLRVQAEQLHAHLQRHPELSPLDVAFTLASTRPRFEERMAVVGSDRSQLLEDLEAFVEGKLASMAIRGRATQGKTAFMFTGQGAQRPGMGAGLYRLFPAFAESLDEVCAELDPLLGSSLKELMFAGKDSTQAALLDETENTQTSLFALEVALFRLLESLGLRPDLLIGHSIGELAAVHVAGVLSLADACLLVAARGRLMGALPSGGAMLAVEATEEEVLQSIEDLGSRVALAAVNGPRAVVLSGEAEVVEEVARLWREQERRTRRLRVSHAFHSPLMEPALEEFRAAAASVELGAPHIPIVSNVSGEVAGEELLNPDYWVTHLRGTVRFAQGVQTLAAAGVTRLLELGPDGVLSAMTRECLEEARDQMLIAPVLHARRAEDEVFATFLAQAETHGVEVDWRAFFAGRGARQVDLPTYAFKRDRYWPQVGAGRGELGSAGLGTATHPLLGAAVQVAGRGEWLFTGQVSVGTHPWLADHVVFDTVLIAGTALVELALAAGAAVGCELLEELTLHVPLVLPESGALQLQLRIGEPDERARRELAVHARRLRPLAAQRHLHPQTECHPTAADLDEEVAWMLHASGSVAPGEEGTLQAAPTADWPPAGAEPVEVEFLYDRLAEAGFGYGPAFQGVRAAWRRGEEIFAEVELDEQHAQDARDYGVHPALLDSALHAAIGERQHSEPGKLLLPFAWAGVRLHRGGAASLRVQLTAEGEDGLRILAREPSGETVLSVESLIARAIDTEQLAAANRAAEDPLFELTWTYIPLSSGDELPKQMTVLGEFDQAVGAEVERCADLPALMKNIDMSALAPEVVLWFASTGAEPEQGELALSAHEQVQRTLKLLQTWLAQERLADTRLALVTRGAVTALPGEAPDPAAAALWGLVRSAQSEHPDRFVLVDLDEGEDEDVPWSELLAAEEPQVALRAGTAYAPRLSRAMAQQEDPAAPAFDLEGTILLTGGTGGLGGVLARHLVNRHGARHLLLVSRRGAEADGASELLGELAELDCEARAVACDIADRAALAAVIEEIPAEHPLTAIVHGAGVLDDGVIETLSAEQVERVMRPKVNGALHLHELTEHLKLSQFVMFSSGAAMLGAPGQGNYAAANSYLDALAARRHAAGLAGKSLAWGLWSEAGGMASELEEGGLAQIRRLGIDALTNEQALALFDAALASDRVQLVPMRFEWAVLRSHARAGLLAPPLRDLVLVAGRRKRAATLAQRLAGVPEDERDALVLELVRGQVAIVLGHDSPGSVEIDRSFEELGFDSLAAVELRNRLAHMLDKRLPATLVFDHPTVAAVADFVRSQVGDIAAPQPAIDDALDRLEKTLAVMANGERERVDARLRGLLSSIGVGTPAALDRQRIESGTAEEIFEMIDNELGLEQSGEVAR